MSAIAEETAPPDAAAAPDSLSLDAALRSVLDSTRPDGGSELDETMEVVSRAALTIDELVERNRAITEAAVRSVEHYRAQVKEARGETDALRLDMDALRKRVREAEAECERVKAAAAARAQEMEEELAAATRELDFANAWIVHFRGHVQHLLGDAEAKLEEAKGEGVF